MSEKNQLQVEAIRHGSVIDHVPAGQGIKILKLFQLIETQERITVGFNLKSGALGKKDLIKIENTCLTEQQANQLALFAPQGHRQHHRRLRGGEEAPTGAAGVHRRVFHCPNSNCISHNEPVESYFRVREG